MASPAASHCDGINLLRDRLQTKTSVKISTDTDMLCIPGQLANIVYMIDHQFK